MKNNYIKIGLATLCLVILAGWYFFDSESNQTSSSIELTEKTVKNSNKNNSDSKLDLPKEVNKNTVVNAPERTPSVISNMILFAVVVAEPVKYSSAVILYNLNPDNYVIGEKIDNTDVVLEEVRDNYVTVSLDGKQYTLNLKGGEADLFAEKNNQIIDDKVTTLTAKEIGNRPKQLDHIITISPENNDYNVAPGINPALFKAVKFKPGDVIQSINGKDVTNPEALAEANALIATAQTLEFMVLRGDRIVTLYLDIPSDDLSISYD